ncbi:MAG: D-glycerate dehydrogenase [Deltaproteobacteria bacterium CG2_30_66_27]|nr:MAG: D-glycerate dehydrogenase [Deltaproteobacteria bacterium CG2_30_66_27]PJB30606.1 MAG: D-glycerate dehydrogenase [Deltaproteobacteria bacterium CG_4_9_14_3_um_filter_65_9]
MERRTIVVTRRLPGVPWDDLAVRFRAGDPPGEGTMPREAFLARARGASGILCTLADRVDEELMEAAGPSLSVVSNFAVGVNNVDVAGATRRGIRVCNTPDVLTDATADLGFALLLSAARKVSDADRFVRAGSWTGWDPWGLLGVPVAGKTLGIVGMGKIGSAVARRSRGFSMKVLYHNRRRIPPSKEAELGASYRDLDALLEESDFVVLCVPLTPETRGLLSAERLGRMKRTAVLVNIARGKVVDEEAVATALAEGRLFGAGLDVFEKEPRIHPKLLSAPSAVLLPHLGSATGETREAMGRLATENLLAVLEGREPPCPVN